MTRKKIFKIIIAVLIAITLFVTLTQNSLCFVGDIGNKFQGTGDKSNATNEMGTLIGKVINVFQVFAMGFAIIMLIFIAVRWIFGSASGKAEMKKASRYYITGAIIIFVAITLLQIVKNFVGGAVAQI